MSKRNTGIPGDTELNIDRLMELFTGYADNLNGQWSRATVAAARRVCRELAKFSHDGLIEVITLDQFDDLQNRAKRYLPGSHNGTKYPDWSTARERVAA